VFSHCKLIKTTIKIDRHRWLKSIDDSLRTKPKDFWKYVSKFMKNDHVVTQLRIGENVLTQPLCIVEAFAGNFSSILTFPLLLFFQTMHVLLWLVF
jgi:hypothetical protein